MFARWIVRALALPFLILGAAAPALAQGEGDPAVPAEVDAAAPDAAPVVHFLTWDDAITPVTRTVIQEAIEEVAESGGAALVIELDTPGGLLDATRDIVSDILDSPVPVLVWVGPAGARAASAGTFITMAAHVAAMAPGTTIGAATPVDLGGGEISDKVINDAVSFARSVAGFHDRDIEFAVDAVREGRSITAEEAVQLGVVDLVVRDSNTLLEMIDGRTVMMADGSEVTLQTGGAAIKTYDPGFFRNVLRLLADPNLAFLFISLGTLAVIYELANPGLGLAGSIGVVLLILGFYSLAVLPVNAAGAALLILAAGLFIAELFVPGIGVLGAGGTIALLLGGLFLFEDPYGVSPAVLWPVALVVGAGVLLAARLTWRARRAPSASGLEALTGREAVVRVAEGLSGEAFVEGAWWRVRSRNGPLAEGQTVTVVAIEGLELIVDTEEEES